MILGSKLLSELEGILDFKSNTLSLMQKSIQMLATHNICIPPGQTQTLTLKANCQNMFVIMMSL